MVLQYLLTWWVVRLLLQVQFFQRSVAKAEAAVGVLRVLCLCLLAVSGFSLAWDAGDQEEGKVCPEGRIEDR